MHMWHGWHWDRMLVSQFGLWTSWPQALQRAGSHIQNGTRIAACQKQNHPVHGKRRNWKKTCRSKDFFHRYLKCHLRLLSDCLLLKNSLRFLSPIWFVLACWGGDGPSAVLRADCGEPETKQKDARRSETSTFAVSNALRLCLDVFDVFHVRLWHFSGAFCLDFLALPCQSTPSVQSNTFTSSIQKWGGGVAGPWPGFATDARSYARSSGIFARHWIRHWIVLGISTFTLHHSYGIMSMCGSSFHGLMSCSCPRLIRHIKAYWGQFKRIQNA